MQPNVPAAAAAIVREVSFDLPTLVVVAALFGVAAPLAGDTLTDQTANVVQRAAVNSQQKLAHVIIALNPAIKGPVITTVLKEAFPSAGISDRHGPYWLSLARTGTKGGEKAPVKPVGARTTPAEPKAAKLPPTSTATPQPPQVVDPAALDEEIRVLLAGKGAAETPVETPVETQPEPAVETQPEPAVETSVETSVETQPEPDAIDAMTRDKLLFELAQRKLPVKGKPDALRARLREAVAAEVAA